MRGKLFLTIVLVAAVAALGGVLVAVAGADDTTALPDVSAPELLARMGDQTRAPQAISGDISWTNELFGDLPVAPEHAGQPAASPLTTSGSGRLWAQDEKVRLESQGSGGDQVLVADGRGRHGVDVHVRRRHGTLVRVGRGRDGRGRRGRRRDADGDEPLAASVAGGPHARPRERLPRSRPRASCRSRSRARPSSRGATSTCSR